MKLNKRQRQLLELMRDGEDCVDEREADAVYVGLERTNVQMLMFFLRNCLIKGPDTSDVDNRYELGEWGRRALDEPDFDPQTELWRGDRRVKR